MARAPHYSGGAPATLDTGVGSTRAAMTARQTAGGGTSGARHWRGRHKGRWRRHAKRPAAAPLGATGGGGKGDLGLGCRSLTTPCPFNPGPSRPLAAPAHPWASPTGWATRRPLASQCRPSKPPLSPINSYIQAPRILSIYMFKNIQFCIFILEALDYSVLTPRLDTTLQDIAFIINAINACFRPFV